MAFTSYRNVRPWAKAIQLAVQTRTMPPWHAAPHYGKFSNDSRMPDSEIEAIVVWAKNGAPEGNAKDLPPLPQFAKGWRIGKPDAVYSIAEYTLGSNTLGSGGNEEQATFYVDTNLKEDVWAEAVEILPGNRKVVHHAIVWLEAGQDAGLVPQVAPEIDDGCSHPAAGEVGSILASYVPGKGPEQWPVGIAKRIPAGARLKFTISYSKSAGEDEKDMTSVGLLLAKRKPEQELRRIDLHNTTFLIPANAESHAVTACHTLIEDADVLSYLVHMRYRGKSIQIEAKYPDGRREILIAIPRYDFQWQTKYLNATPVRIPKGTRIELKATFDNSPNNRNNPDPSRQIRWGEGAADERMDGWIEFVTPKR